MNGALNVPTVFVNWYYIGKDGIHYGPFIANQMNEWLKSGHFPENTMFRAENTAFYPMHEWILRCGNNFLFISPPEAELMNCNSSISQFSYSPSSTLPISLQPSCIQAAVVASQAAAHHLFQQQHTSQSLMANTQSMAAGMTVGIPPMFPTPAFAMPAHLLNNANCWMDPTAAADSTTTTSNSPAVEEMAQMMQMRCYASNKEQSMEVLQNSSQNIVKVACDACTYTDEVACEDKACQTNEIILSRDAVQDFFSTLLGFRIEIFG